MKEKEYKTWLEEAKAALDAYSAEQTEIAKLYEQAKAEAETAHKAQKEQLAKDTKTSKNQAVVDTMKTERDLDRTLASRGLAFSGENAQTSLDLALDLRGRLAELEDEAAEKQAELDARHRDTQNQLSMAYAKERSQGAEKLADLQMAMANAAKQAEEQTSQDGDKTENGGEDSYGVPYPDLTGMSFSGRVKAMAEYAEKVRKAKEAADKLTPEISPKELAKQLVSAAGENGVIGSIAQQEALEGMLARLTEAHDLSEGYLEELMLNLRSLGYRSDYRQDVAYGMEDLQNRSAKAYADYYDRYYRVYRSAGYDAEESDKLAGEQALFLQFVYLYRNSKSKEMFETAMSGLGYRNELGDFYARIGEEPNKYALGSEVQP
ncbi:MAG: hypothetical protein IKK06_04815 [Clostridia bacterium]|nr:hypothetical protein [Clostridia bacterium]